MMEGQLCGSGHPVRSGTGLNTVCVDMGLEDRLFFLPSTKPLVLPSIHRPFCFSGTRGPRRPLGLQSCCFRSHPFHNNVFLHLPVWLPSDDLGLMCLLFAHSVSKRWIVCVNLARRSHYMYQSNKVMKVWPPTRHPLAATMRVMTCPRWSVRHKLYVSGSHPMLPLGGESLYVLCARRRGAPVPVG